MVISVLNMTKGRESPHSKRPFTHSFVTSILGNLVEIIMTNARKVRT